jgi:hypothetical protein
MTMAVGDPPIEGDGDRREGARLTYAPGRVRGCNERALRASDPERVAKTALGVEGTVRLRGEEDLAFESVELRVVVVLQIEDRKF